MMLGGEEACALMHKRKSFPRSAVARKRRRHPAIELLIITSHHHLLLITNITPTLRPYTYTPPPLQETPTISRSFYHPPTPPDCIFRQRHNSWSSPFRFVSPAKTNSLGHHHQKVRSQLQTAIDRNPRRPQTNQPPRGNDTALLRTRRCSKIPNKQALASRSQSRGHSSASE